MVASGSGRFPTGAVAGLVVGLLVLVGGLGITLTRTPAWTAASTLLVSPHTPNNDPDTLASLYDTLSQGQVPATFAELFRGRDVVDTAERRAGLSAAERAAARVSVEVVADTSVIRLTATAPDAALAVRVADAMAQEARSRVDAAPATPYGVSIASSARGTATRSGPGRTSLAAVSVLAALLAGFAVQQVWAGVVRGRRFDRALTAEWPDLAPRAPAPNG